MTKDHLTATSPQGKPAKPRPDPLFARWNGRVGRWCRKIRGRLHYFGPWDDPDGAEHRYLDQRETPRKGCET
jgi:hypothetical protein